MKKNIILGILMLSNLAIGQNEFPQNDDVLIKGKSLRISRPITTGGWEQGVRFFDLNNQNQYGELGMKGSGANSERIFIAYGTNDDSASSAWRSKKSINLLSNGKVGIGTTNPSYNLDVSGNIRSIKMTNYENDQQSTQGIHSYYISDFSNVTNSQIKSYDIGMYSNLEYTIPFGVRDIGYKTSIFANGASQLDGFAGTLDVNRGLWAWAGIVDAESGATIKNAIAIDAKVMLRANVNTTVENAYGVKIVSDHGSTATTNVINKYDLFAGTPDAKNYFAGTLGVGTANPKGMLHVGDDSNAGIVFKNRIGEVESIIPAQFAWGESTMGVAGDLIIAPRTDISTSIRFFTNTSNTVSEKMRISGNGNVSIGTINTSDSTGDYKLSVKGKVRAEEVKVYTGWSDFVFEKDYNLPTLKDVEKHIKEKGHLKDIPNAKEVEENGIYLGEINAKLLQKIEELTLYTIQQEKDIKSLNSVKDENEELKQRVDKLEKLVEKLIKK